MSAKHDAAGERRSEARKTSRFVKRVPEVRRFVWAEQLRTHTWCVVRLSAAERDSNSVASNRGFIMASFNILSRHFLPPCAVNLLHQ